MLSRVAESIFWIGRYIERAEGTARILDVVVHQVLEDRATTSQEAADRLLAVMGLPAPSPPLDLWQATELLAHDRDSRSSITGALIAARGNARAVRHLVSIEFWESLNTTYVALDAQRIRSRAMGPHVFLSFVKTQTATLTGLADSTMSRDRSWLFLSLGRALERADVGARQLAARPFAELTEGGLITLLRSCGGYEAYLRSSHGMIDRERVAAFLLRDRQFPRSVFSALVTAEACLAAINPTAEQYGDMARLLIGRARADLEFAPPDLLFETLSAQLFRVLSACAQASDAISGQYFVHDPPTSWRSRVAS